MVKLTTQQIGKCDELPVQYMLFKHEVESAPLTTDLGIDLEAFPNVEVSPEERQKPLTTRVNPSNHLGRTANKWLEWQIPEEGPAAYIEAADLIRGKFLLIRTGRFKQ